MLPDYTFFVHAKKMEFYSMKERWGDIGEVRMFLYTHVIYKYNSDYFCARVPGRYASPRELPVIEPCLLQKLDGANVWPPLEQEIQVCYQPHEFDLHIKRPRLAEYDGSPVIGQYLVHEARVCQVLTSHPHPNIVRFHGCTVGGRNEITGLCFDKYTETLTERIQNGFPVDTKSCMAQIHAAVQHLHAQNLVHNDIVPDNIMFKSFGPSLALVDFDSCTTRGYGLPKKRGPCPPAADSSEFENDYYGMELIHNMLLKYEDKMRCRR
ncbi:hypothetical protein NLG97_g4293 [Lecanicillium saksenae]|uniref:Uncharacterized protein n=1 Tax=Lecanicillium saksenae TaxID=468837 RepID=A0ACC1QWW6_9HYPO|nr:hypothetical protein NLG97_g4293 [Lecanicillium saksenae]